MGDTIEFDVVVIGAGVVGLAIANEISEIYDNVIVIEKESDFGQHVSSRHSGVIHSGIYYKPDSLKAKLCVEGNKLLYDFAKSKNIGHLNCGKLVVGHDTKDLRKLDALLENGKANGVEGLSLLSNQEALRIQPGIKCKGALWVPSSGIIDSHELMVNLEREAISKDCLVHYNSEVSSIEKIGNYYNVSLKGQQDSIKSPILINSAGLWCNEVARMLGIEKYRIHYCKGDYYQSNRYKDLKCLVYPLPSKIGLGIHTVIQLDGSVSFGPNAYYVDEINYDIDDRNLDTFHSAINKYIDIEKDDLKVDYSGIRPKPFAANQEPKDFVITNESDIGFPNLINLIGIESPGLTSSLAIGRFVKDMVNL